MEASKSKNKSKNYEPTLMKGIRKLGGSYTVSIPLNKHYTRLCSCRNIQYAIVIRDLALKHLNFHSSSYNAYETTKNLPVPEELKIKIGLLQNVDIAHNYVILNDIVVNDVILRINDECSIIPPQWNVMLFKRFTAPLSKPITYEHTTTAGSNKKRTFAYVSDPNSVIEPPSEIETTTTTTTSGVTDINPYQHQTALPSSSRAASLQESHIKINLYSSERYMIFRYIQKIGDKYSIFLSGSGSKRVCTTSNIKYAIIVRDLCDKHLNITKDPIARSITQDMNIPENLAIKINLLSKHDPKHKNVNIDELVFDNMTLLKNAVDHEIPTSWNVKFKKERKRPSPLDIMAIDETYSKESDKRRKIIAETDDDSSVTSVDPAAPVVTTAVDVEDNFIPRSSSSSVFLQRYGNLAIFPHTNAAVYSPSAASQNYGNKISATSAASLILNPQPIVFSELPAYKQIEQRKAELAARLKVLEEQKAARANSLNTLNKQHEDIIAKHTNSYKMQ